MMTKRSAKNHHKKCHLSMNNTSTSDLSTTFFGESFKTPNERNAINDVTSKDDLTSSVVEFPHMNQCSADFFGVVGVPQFHGHIFKATLLHQ